MGGLKFRLGFTFLVLLAVGMILVNLVIMLLWQRDVQQRERARCLAAYQKGSTLLVKRPTIPAETLLHELGLGKGSCVAVRDSQGGLHVAPEECRYTRTLDEQLGEGSNNLNGTAHFVGTAWGVFSSRPRLVVASGALPAGAKTGGGLAIALSLDPAFHHLQWTEQIILVYLLINLIILGVIAFFRIVDIAVRPIERLIERADQYASDGDPLFFADREGSEFHQLGSSLNRLVQRIEEDRCSLQETVARLGQANRQLKENQQEMIRTEKLASVGRLAAGLAHEIGNPLGIVQGYLGVLGQKELDDQVRKDCHLRAEEELRRVSALIRQLLDFARTQRESKELVSVQGILLAVLELVQQQPAARGIRLETDLQAERDMVLADEDQLRQVFLNCLLNGLDAVRAADKGAEGLLKIRTENIVSRKGQKVQLVIRITDNGIGIEPDILNNIFDPFFTTKEPGQGTGLGLSVSLTIIESLGGSMEMRSHPGKGSEMSIRLPVSMGEEIVADTLHGPEKSEPSGEQ